jgi:hypothetical protein
MKSLLLSTTVLAISLASTPTMAQVLPPPDHLHGQCSAGCPEDTATSSTPITAANAEVNFDFSVSSGGQGDLYLAFLVPNIDVTLPNVMNDSASGEGTAGDLCN